MLKTILNKMIMKVHAVRSVANDPLNKYKFRVTIPGLATGIGFQKVSGLKREMGILEYSEGGYSAVRKMKGKEKIEPIVLERGMFADKDLQQLYVDSLSSATSRTTITIELLDKQDTTARTWTLGEAWVKSWEGSDLDAMSEDVAIEKIIVEAEYYID